jgi:hypothetical protein
MKRDGAVKIDRSKFLALATALATAVACGNYHVVDTVAGDDASADDATSQPDVRDSGTPDSGLTCTGGKTACGSSCVDTSNDPQHCGNCTKTCTTGGDCWNGQCCYPSTEGGGFGNGVCVVYPGCGCPSGQMCTRKAAGPEQCVPNGTTPANGTCVDTYQCEPNFACTGGYCQPMCITNTNCAANWACLPQFWGGQTFLGYSACDPHCNPVASSTSDSTHQGCITGQRCDPLFNAAGQTTCNSPAGTGVQGSACTPPTSANCAPNYDCVSPGGQSYRCEQYCRIGFSDCLTGSCTAYTTPQYDNTQEIGVCQ